jgi:hypothetical protein
VKDHDKNDTHEIPIPAAIVVRTAGWLGILSVKQRFNNGTSNYIA